MAKSKEIYFLLKTLAEKHDIVISVFLILFIAAFYLVTLNDGHPWMDDSAMYIMHAANIAEGRAYCDTCYLYNPENPYVGPRCYPPIYPIALAPVYKSFGMNFKAMKAENVFFFMLFLFFLYLFFKKRLDGHYALFAVFMTGMNFKFWKFSNMVYSDFLFCLLVYLFFWAHKNGEKKYINYAGLGFLGWLAYAARLPGVLLPLSVLVAEAARGRRQFFSQEWKRLSVMLGIFFCLALAQGIVMNCGFAYADQLADSFKGHPWKFIRMAKMVFASLYALFYSAQDQSAFMDSAAFFLFVLFVFFVVLGLWSLRRNFFEPFNIFAFSYLFLICFGGIYDGIRYLFPVIPAFMLYAFCGIRNFRKLQIAGFVFAAGIFISYVSGYLFFSDFKTKDRGFLSKNAVQTFYFLRFG